MKNTFKGLKDFILLWLTQSLSALGSSMTGFALVIWLYNDSGSALTTAMLTVCSYAPYVVMSIFAGAISDKWNKKTVMLVCDSLAAVSTAVIFILLKTGCLQVWHLYLLNAFNGLMNTIQQPASDVAETLLIPPEYYQKTSSMRSFSNSLVSILTPVLAAAVVSFAGIDAVIMIDLLTFAAAFITLLFFIRIPRKESGSAQNESVLKTAMGGVFYLRSNKGILWLMLFLAAINLIASVYEAALPAMILSKSDEEALGVVNACVGIATLAGSIISAVLPAPKSRIRAVCNCLLISMSTENFMLALGKGPIVWCIGAILGWLSIPFMNANMDVIMRTRIPVEMQGRVFSVRNTLQFFTIPLGYFIGGVLVDSVFEPFMSLLPDDSFLCGIFGFGKGSGAALLFMFAGFAGVAVCLIFRRVRYIRELE